MAEIIILLEKKRKNVTHDGTVKEILEKAAHLRSCLLSMISPWEEEESPKDSSGWKEEESPKDSSGWEEKAKKVAASEQNTSKGKDRSNSLPRSNKKRKRKTCINKFAVIEPKYIYRLIVYLILIGTLVSGANGEVIKREDFRSITMATSEMEVATHPVLTPVDGVNYLIFARDGNCPASYKCTPEFVAVNQSCNIYVGDKNKTECEGLQIFENETHIHLNVDRSKLTHDHTIFCILQQIPGSFILYPLGVFKKHDQVPEAVKLSEASDDVTTSSIATTWTAPNGIVEYYDVSCPVGDPSPPKVNPSDNLTASCVNLPRPGDDYSISVTTFSYGQRSETDTITITASPKTNGYKVAFYFLLSIVIFLVIAIAIKKNFPCIHAWWKKELMKQVPTNDPDQDPNNTAFEDLEAR